jgi:Rv0078B-related antitoxin
MSARGGLRHAPRRVPGRPLSALENEGVSDNRAAARLRLALDMYEFGEQMQRARLRRLHPDATEDEIDAAIGSWLLSRPGAPLGNAVGRLSHRFG